MADFNEAQVAIDFLTEQRNAALNAQAQMAVELRRIQLENAKLKAAISSNEEQNG